MPRGSAVLSACVALSLATGASAEGETPACPTIDQAVSAVLASETRARSDVTEAFRCLFPDGMTFNQAAKLLDAGGFELLNRTEPMFHRWKLPGEEFVSRRRFVGFGATVEIRVAFHVVDRRIVRFSAQYLSGR